MIPQSQVTPRGAFREGVPQMFNFLIGFAFVAMILGPAILASIQRASSHDTDF